MAASEIPIVSGVGHETDFTIADFVADWRAATPTAAAEAVTPDAVDLLAQCAGTEARLILAMNRWLQNHRQRWQHALNSISSPARVVASHSQRVDYLEHRLQSALQRLITQGQHRLSLLKASLSAQNPQQVVERAFKPACPWRCSGG